MLMMGYGSPNGAEDLPGVPRRRPARPSSVAVYGRRIRPGGTRRLVGPPKTGSSPRWGRSSSEDSVGISPGPASFSGSSMVIRHSGTWCPKPLVRGSGTLIAVPLSPYASTWISEPYREGVAEGIRASASPITVDVRLDWHLDPNWLGYWNRAIRTAVASNSDPTGAVLLSAHSLPQRMRDRGDPYPEILQETSSAIAQGAGLARWSFAYQSAGNTTEAWLGPDLTDVMLDWQRRGAKRQWIASFGFVFEHLEVLYDLDVVVREFAASHGIDYRRVPMPNDADEVVEALAARVLAPPSKPKRPARYGS